MPNAELMKEDEDDEYARYLNMDGKMEDVRESNLIFSQTKVQAFLTFYYSVIGIGSSIIASEINMYYNSEDYNKGWVITMMSICNISTLFMSKHNLK